MQASYGGQVTIDRRTAQKVKARNAKKVKAKSGEDKARVRTSLYIYDLLAA